jgi:hypothetical protein
MTTTNIARLQDMVRINCPGALDGVIRMEMFNVLKEFFQRTNAWMLEVPVYVIPTSNDYQIDTGQNVVVNRLMAIQRMSSPLPPGGPWSPSYAPMCPPQYLAVSTDGTASVESQNPMFRTWRAGALLNAGTKCPILRITQNPGVAETWISTLALTPCDPTDSDGFVSPPDWVMEKYLSYIRSGIVCQLMLQPGKPYSSVPGSQYHGRKFNEGVGLARTDVRHMFGYDAQHWQFPNGWSSRFRFTGAFS